MDQKLCQSCAMPMTEENHFGKNADGSKNEDYCCYCYVNGQFSKDETMAEMIETCVPFALEAGVYKSAEEARKGMESFFPTLKRWNKG